MYLIFCIGSFLAQVLLFIQYYEGIHALDKGVRSAYGTNTSTGGIFATYPADFSSVVTVLFDQIFGTMMLLIPVCAITDPNGIKLPSHIQPVVISLLVTGLASGFSTNAGAVLNPARDLAPRIFTAIAGYGWEPFKPLNYHYWYVAGLVGPHLGAIIGCYLYLWLVGNYNETLELEERSNAEFDQNSKLEHQSLMKSE